MPHRTMQSMHDTNALEPFKQFEHQGWCRVAQRYDTAFGSATTQAIAPMLEAVGVVAGAKVLDVACGPGYVAAAAAKCGASVLGIDFAADMVQLARLKWPGLAFEVGDAERLALPAASFDVVLMNFGILHLADPQAAIAQAFAVLRPGGHFAFTVWMPPPHTVPFAIVLEAVEQHGQLNIGVPPGPPMFRFSDQDEAARTLTAAGFASTHNAPLDISLPLETPDDLFQIMLEGGVRTAGLLQAQSAAALAKIREHMSSSVKLWKVPESPRAVYRLPMPARLITAQRPVR
ncbi:MAG: class I SAM-dependent methyltransferase [Planctomycetota bacterium]|nr:class I SAM-dependent methyltransferase [Planctomycetota bacterium]